MRATIWTPMATWFLLGLGNTGCDDVDWPEARYIDSVRVLGVRADPPTLTPGATTQLSVACMDGRRGASAEPTCDVQIAWFAQCNNPPENDPKRCLAVYSPWANSLRAPLEATLAADYPEGFGWGPRFAFSAPLDILSASTDVGGRAAHYGTSYVFFIVCAGQLTPVHGVSERLPVECRDPETNELLDQRSYVVGVATLYSYDSFISLNPIVQSSSFDGVQLPGGCDTHLDCPSDFECSDSSRCVPVVEPCRSRGAGCSEHCLRLDLAPDSFGLFGADHARLAAPSKSLWLSHFTNAGQLPDDDESFPVAGPGDPTSETQTRCVHWQAPSIPTEHAHLWAVLRDSRGGFTVWDQRIVVR